MDEFVVIEVMNESMLRLKKMKNKDYKKNEKIREYLEDKNFFKKASEELAKEVLTDVGVADDKIEETYKKLIKDS